MSEHRDKVVRAVGNLALSKIRLQGGVADQWFKTEEFCLASLLMEVGCAGADGDLKWADGLLLEVERWINAAPIREITQEEVDRTYRCGKVAGIQQAAEFLMGMAAGHFKGGEDERAKFLRDAARSLEGLKNVEAQK